MMNNLVGKICSWWGGYGCFCLINYIKISVSFFQLSFILMLLFENFVWAEPYLNYYSDVAPKISKTRSDNDTFEGYGSKIFIASNSIDEIPVYFQNNPESLQYHDYIPETVSIIYGRRTNDDIYGTWEQINIHKDDYPYLSNNMVFYTLYSDTAELYDNSVYVNGGSFRNILGTYSGSKSVKNNVFNINNANFRKVIGAISRSGSIESNKLYVKDSNFDTVYGANLQDVGEGIKNNLLHINGGTLNNSVIGSYFSATRGNRDSVVIDNNIIELDGDININSDKNISIYAVKVNGGIVKNNKMILGHNLKLLGSNLSKLKIFGYNPSVINKSNNTLEIYTKNIKLKEINNFDNYYFILPEDISNGETILDTISPVDISAANIGIAMNSNVQLNEGDKVILMSNASGDINLVSLDENELEYPDDIFVVKNKETTLTKSSSIIKYGIDLNYNENNQLEMTIDKVENVPITNVEIKNNFEPVPNKTETETEAKTETNTENKAEPESENKTEIKTQTETSSKAIYANPVPELKPEAVSMFNGRIVPFSLLENSIVANMDLSDMQYNENVNDNISVNIMPVSTFFNIGNINTTMNNGTKISGYNFASGLLFNFSNTSFGLFVSSGVADYKTKDNNSYMYDGSGNLSFIGGGFIVKQNLFSTLKTQTYFDMHLDLGMMNNNWSYNTDETIGYNLSTKYMASHFGLGIKIAINSVLENELYSKYFYSFVMGNNTVIGNDYVNFCDMDERKFRIGTKLKLKMFDNFKHYVGFGADVKENKNDNVIGYVNGMPVNEYGKNSSDELYNAGMINKKKYRDYKMFLEYGIMAKLFGERLRTDLKISGDYYKYSENYLNDINENNEKSLPKNKKRKYSIGFNFGLQYSF